MAGHVAQLFHQILGRGETINLCQHRIGGEKFPFRRRLENPIRRVLVDAPEHGLREPQRVLGLLMLPDLAFEIRHMPADLQLGDHLSAQALQSTLGLKKNHWPREWAALTPSWDRLPPDAHLRDGGHYRRRRHGCPAAPAARSGVSDTSWARGRGRGAAVVGTVTVGFDTQDQGPPA